MYVCVIIIDDNPTKSAGIMKFLKEFLIILCGISLVSAWDTEQLEIFDLVQDINRNFYDLIGVSQVSLLTLALESF